MVWISNDKSWCCNTTIWYFSTECIPEVGTVGIWISTKNLNFYQGWYQMFVLCMEFMVLTVQRRMIQWRTFHCRIFQWRTFQWRTFQWRTFQWRILQWRTISGECFMKKHWNLFSKFSSTNGTYTTLQIFSW